MGNATSKAMKSRKKSTPIRDNATSVSADLETLDVSDSATPMKGRASGKRKSLNNDTSRSSSKKVRRSDPSTIRDDSVVVTAKGKAKISDKPKTTSRWFDMYASETDKDLIDVTGVTRLLEDLKIKIDGASIYVLFWKLDCESMGEIPRSKWVSGLRTERITNEDQLLKALPQWLRDVKPTTPASDTFLKFYKFMFNFSKASPETKSVTLESAVAVLTFLLDPTSYDVNYDPEKATPLPIEQRPFPHGEAFLKFLTEKEPRKVINKDQWESFIPFNKSVRYDLENYNPEGAWPGLFDQYVEYRKETENIKPTPDPNGAPDTES